VSPAVLTLLAALVGAGAAITAQTLGPIVTARRAQRTWIRDKRASICEQYVSMVLDLIVMIEKRGAELEDGPGGDRFSTEEAYKDWLDNTFGPCAGHVYRITIQLSIYGPPELVAAFHFVGYAVNNYASTLSPLSEGHGLIDGELKSAMDEAYRQIDRALGIKGHPVSPLGHDMPMVRARHGRLGLHYDDRN
jgi:hypothetical protein